MVRHLLVRVATGLAVVAGVMALTFLLLHLAPGDPAIHLAGPTATPEQLAALRAELGLDRPLPLQFGTWLARAATGDWGISLATGRPVSRMLAEAWPATALLVLVSLSASYLLGILVGLIQVTGSGARDATLSTATVTLFAMPGYWLGLLFIWFFAYQMQWLPAFGAAGLDADFLSAGERLIDRLRHLALPCLTLTLIGVGGAARFVRGSLLDVRGSTYLTAAEGRGLPPATVTRRYLLANALGPVVVLLGLSLPALFSGAVFVEGIFAWPGVGRVLIEAVQSRDYPVVMAAATASAILVVLGNLLADGLGTWVDPRLRHG
ncbi:MAG TPA: ABC transporter permease [Gemmatimonadales bacterium]|nr:ABC transporter permease [Gemmatimonadales bacterium]